MPEGPPEREWRLTAGEITREPCPRTFAAAAPRNPPIPAALLAAATPLA